MTAPKIQPSPLPTGSVLAALDRAAYTDCYCVEWPAIITLEMFVEAFYTSRLFKLERALLALAGHRATDADARRLARGAADRFAAWSVERREADQILLATGPTRSWLMVAAARDGAAGSTLYFGSAIVPPRRNADGSVRLGGLFAALLGFHKLYSRALLAAAWRRLAVMTRAA